MAFHQALRMVFCCKSGSDFDGIARHVPAQRLLFARFDPRQIGPRLPAPAGATAAPARQARPDLHTARLRNIPCLPPCGVQQSGRAVPHRGTAFPTLGPGRGAEVRVSKHLLSNTESLGTSLRCCWCLRDLTRVKSGRACLPRQARQPRQPDGAPRFTNRQIAEHPLLAALRP